MNESEHNTAVNEPLLNIKPRFFVAPKLDARLTDLIEQEKTHRPKPRKENSIMRYAGYVRISSDEQVGNYSIEAQTRAIKAWVEAQNGRLIKIYCDEAQSGRTSQRPAFLEMRQDARKRKFDAIVVHKFDRFARNRTDALAIKSLLRYDYNIKVFSVTEPSEDSDGPIGALIEGIMESVAEWYSKNLATEVAKGRKEKHAQGFHNNSAPFGYKLDGKKLVPNPDEVPGLLMAFQAYATGKFSYLEIARLLNEHGYKSTSGRAFSKFAIRTILHNQIYIGKVRYQETLYDSNGKRLYSARIDWIAGQHEPLISTELWEACQHASGKRATHRQSTARYRPYLLRGLVYCQHCSADIPPDKDFRRRGKMYCQTQTKMKTRMQHSYYKCSSQEAGFECPEPSVPVRDLDCQVIAILSQLKPPAEWRDRLLSTISNILGEQSLEERLREIRATIERMDFRWDNGFITDKYDYMEKRLKLQQELERLTPEPDDLEAAVDLLENFKARFDASEGDIEAQRDLIKLIVERVYVHNRRVYAITLKADYHVLLGHDGGGDIPEMKVDMSIHDCSRRAMNPHHVTRWVLQWRLSFGLCMEINRSLKSQRAA